MCVCVCVCVCVRACVHACVRACVRASVHACERAGQMKGNISAHWIMGNENQPASDRNRERNMNLNFFRHDLLHII